MASTLSPLTSHVRLKIFLRVCEVKNHYILDDLEALTLKFVPGTAVRVRCIPPDVGLKLTLQDIRTRTVVERLVYRSTYTIVIVTHRYPWSLSLPCPQHQRRPAEKERRRGWATTSTRYTGTQQGQFGGRKRMDSVKRNFLKNSDA